MEGIFIRTKSTLALYNHFEIVNSTGVMCFNDKTKPIEKILECVTNEKAINLLDEIQECIFENVNVLDWSEWNRDNV